MDPRPNLVLLLGAGFSSNWGGLLADDFFDHLLSRPEVNQLLTDLLWKYRRRGGFEAALAELQARKRLGNADAQDAFKRLSDAVLALFERMDNTYRTTNFEFQTNGEYQVAPFLARFDAIFSLNQDLLSERRYFSGDVALHAPGKWTGAQMPGLKSISPSAALEGRFLGTWKQHSPDCRLSPRLQPFFKLHGSCNWVGDDGQSLLIVGGEKDSVIDSYPVLRWYRLQFAEYLTKPRTRIVVVGYSFRDSHINRAIHDAVAGGQAKLFVIDPAARDMFDESDNPLALLRPHVTGVSRHMLRDIFGGNHPAHAQLVEWLAARPTQ